MLAIAFRFPAGRYHATPWDAHVNEGRVEWPPSPWRLLRALLAVWHRKLHDELSEEAIDALLSRLASVRPQFALPRASIAHSRHYMPVPGTTTKVFDTWANVTEPLFAFWPVDAVDSELATLDRLLGALNYLGRSESWIEAVRVDHSSMPRINSKPLEEKPERGMDCVRLLCPLGHPDFVSWLRQNAASEELVDKGKSGKAKPAKGKKGPGLPLSLREALELETSELRQQGWSQAPGAQWVDYTRPADAFSPRVGGRANAMTQTPNTARFALRSAVLPHLREAVALSERFHTALVARSDGATVFTGCDEHKRPLPGHQHCFILPEANARSPYLSHVTLHARAGFDADAREVLGALRQLWGQGGHELELVLLGMGEAAEFGGTDTTREQCPLLAQSRVWVSRTPFVPTRFPKQTRRGEPKRDQNGLQLGTPEHDLRRLLAELGLPEPVAMERIDATWLAGKALPWYRFRTQRLNGQGKRGPAGAYGFRISFAEPVSGPIAVGYAAHFGLGQFVPD